jgi:hypothetical protein
MRILRTFQVMGEAAETRDLRCPACGFRSTSITIMLTRPQARKRGHGAVAVRNQISAGVLSVQVEKKP